MATIHKRTDNAGRSTFQVKIRRAGHPPLSRTFPSRLLADQWAAEHEAQIARGTLIDPTLARSVTMGELFSRYLADVTPAKKGVAQECYVLLALAGSKLAAYSPGTLTAGAVREWRDQRLKEVAPGTVNRALAVLSHVIEHARKEWGIELPGNPVGATSRPKNPKGRDRRLVGDEESRLPAACGGGRGRRAAYLRDIVRLAIETAMRRSEMLALLWENIDLDRATAHLPDSKNGDARTVPLSKAAIRLLEAIRPAGNPMGEVWPTATGESIKQAFARACVRAGILGLRFHDPRHGSHPASLRRD